MSPLSDSDSPTLPPLTHTANTQYFWRPRNIEASVILEPTQPTYPASNSAYNNGARGYDDDDNIGFGRRRGRGLGRERRRGGGLVSSLITMAMDEASSRSGGGGAQRGGGGSNSGGGGGMRWCIVLRYTGPDPQAQAAFASESGFAPAGTGW